MAGSKRRRGSSKTPTRSTTTASSPSSPSPKEDGSSVTSESYKHLLLLSQSEERSVAVLQAFVDSPCSLSGDEDDTAPTMSNLDCYWVVLGVQTMNRQLKKLKDDPTSLSTCCLLSSFAHVMCKILLSDEHKLERATGSSSQSRSILGRAIVTVVSSCVVSLNCLAQPSTTTGNPSKQEADTYCRALYLASYTLDVMIHMQRAKKGDDDEAGKVDFVEELYDLNSSQDLVDLVAQNEAEQEQFTACHQLLLTADTEDQSAEAASVPEQQENTTKRSRRGKSKSAKQANVPVSSAENAETLNGAFRALLETENVRIDGRVAAKKWATSVLGWLCQGETRTIGILKALIEAKSSWVTFFNEGSLGFSGSHAMVIICCHLSRVVAEESSYGGRGLGSGVEHYLKIIVGGERSAKAKKADHPTAADDTLHIIYEFIQLNKDYLDDQSRDPTPVSPGGQHVPDTAAALVCLSQGVSSHARAAQRVMYEKTLANWAAVWSLKLASTHSRVMDSRHILFTLDQLQCCLEILELGKSTGNRKSRSDLDKDLQLELPLQIPTAQPATRKVRGGKKAKKSSRLDASQGSQFWISSEAARQEANCAMFLRAFNDGTDDPIGRFYTTILSILSLVYESKIVLQSIPKVVAAAAPSGSQSLEESGETSPARKRKRSLDEVVAMDTTAAAVPNRRSRMSAKEASIAVSALTSLRECLLLDKTAGISLRTMFRESFNVTLVKTFIRLGETLDDFMIQNHDVREYTTSNISDDQMPQSDARMLDEPSSDAYSINEKLVWGAHIDVCNVLGRGAVAFDYSKSANAGKEDTILGNLLSRQDIYSSIGNCGDKETPQWSLAIPLPHHAFLVANMSGESMPASTADSAPEQIIVSGYVDGVVAFLSDLQAAETQGDQDRFASSEGRPPLSHRDAQTLMLAYVRLQKGEQMKHLELLVCKTLETVNQLRDSAHLQTFLRTCAAPSFISRTLVICASMIDTAVVGSAFRDAYMEKIGATSFSLPMIYSSTEWYRSAICYTNVCGDWEAPWITETQFPIAQFHSTVAKNWKALLQVSFFLGFLSAKDDKCQLIYTAWNMQGKFDRLHSPNSRGAVSSPTLRAPSDEIHLSTHILELRDDVCLVNALMDRKVELSPKVKILLEDMIVRAEKLIDSALANNQKLIDSHQQASLFTLLAAIPAYIASAVSAHTTRGTDAYSTALASLPDSDLGRTRTYSSESDPMHSDGDSCDIDASTDQKAGALSRLHECCDAFGAAPVHPDFLDITCKLKRGVSVADASKVAEIAIRCLTKLATASFQHMKQMQQQVVKVLTSDQDNATHLAALGVSLCQWCTHDVSAPSTEQEWREMIAAFTAVDPEVIDILFQDGSISESEQIKEAWCPNAAQRIRGLLHRHGRLLNGWETNAAELRAAGEWELLLAEALATANVDLINFPVAVLEDEGLPTATVTRANEWMNQAQGWKNVCFSAVSNLVSASALLRLALGKVGRKPHPFVQVENHQNPYDKVPVHFVESFSGKSDVTRSLKVVVHDACLMLTKLCTQGSEMWSTTCHAAACHLLIDSVDFAEIESLQDLQIAFNVLKWIHDLSEKSKEPTILSTTPKLVERLLEILGRFGCHNHPNINASTTSDYNRLLPFFTASTSMCVPTIVDAKRKMNDILSGGLNGLFQDVTLPYTWDNQSGQSSSIQELLNVIIGNKWAATQRSRSLAATMLSSCLSQEFHLNLGETTSKTKVVSVVRRSVVKLCNAWDGEQLTEWLQKDFCGSSKVVSDVLESGSAQYKKDIALILSLLLLPSNGIDPFQHGKMFSDTMCRSFDSWILADFESMSYIATVSLLYCCLHETVHELFEKFATLNFLVTDTTDDEKDRGTDKVKLVNQLLKFLNSLRTRTEDQQPTTRPSETLSQKPSTLASLPSRCSYEVKKGFHGQHWYNCYTCGLIFDKGCCTICALVCHRGHDVSYSRYSSFFCDCGADGGGALETSRVSCQCLSKVSEEEMASLSPNSEGLSNHTRKPISFDINAICLHVTSRILESNGFSDDRFGKSINAATISETLFRVLKKSFDTWKAGVKNQKGFVESIWLDDQVPLKPSRETFAELQRQVGRKNMSQLRQRSLEASSLLPVRAVRGFQMHSDTETTAQGRQTSRAEKVNVKTNLLVADHRGRFILAESSSLVFFSPIPAINIKCPIQSTRTILNRDRMAILGVSRMPFSTVTGMRLCQANTRHVAVWTRVSAHICIAKVDWDGVEKTVDLTLDSAVFDVSSDSVQRCAWIPFSQSHIVVCCQRHVYVYDLDRVSGENKCNPITSHRIAEDSSIDDMAVVAPDAADAERSIGVTQNFTRIFLTLKDGTMHELMLRSSRNGKLEMFQSGLPHRDMIAPSADQASNAKSDATSGKAAGYLVYLAQSRLLLQKSVDSSVIANQLGDDGGITGSFQFLPDTVIAATRENGNESNVSIQGPFTHWTELGIITRDNEPYFRVVCIGRSSKDSSCKVLCLEFNQQNVNVQELNWISGIGACVSEKSEFCGASSFSVPVHVKDEAGSPSFSERVFIAMLDSKGTMFIYSDHNIAERKPDNTKDRLSIELNQFGTSNTQQRLSELTAFEQMDNISESDRLSFRGINLGCDPGDLHRRLPVRDGVAFLASPSSEGCTFAMSISNVPSIALGAKRPKERTNPFVIAAIRVLVGSSSSNSSPSSIIVQGRQIDISPNTKKYYSIPLTHEEIAVGIRSGLVSVTIGSSFGSSARPVIDGLEVYAIRRDTISNWFPTSSLAAEIEGNDLVDYANKRIPALKLTKNSSNLATSMVAMAHLSDLSSSVILSPEQHEAFLRELIQATALQSNKQLWKCAKSVLVRSFADARACAAFIDENILVGCSNVFQDCWDSYQRMDDGEQAAKDTIDELMQERLEQSIDFAVNVARCRPMNYLRTTETIMERHLGRTSIANDACKLVLNCLERNSMYEALVGGKQGIVDLALTEIAMRLNADTTHSKRFAKFEVLRPFLDSERLSVVARCSQAISNFCKCHGMEHGNGGRPDLFTQIDRTRLVLYQCDSCNLCPMKGVRYTLPDNINDIDLCETCWSSGTAYAESKGHRQGEPVEIDGQTIGHANAKLTCSQIRQMKPVSLLSMDVEQVDMDVDGEDVRMRGPESEGETTGQTGLDSNRSQHVLDFENFIGHLFLQVSEVLVDAIKKKRQPPYIGILLRLLLDLIRYTRSDESKIIRAKRMANIIVEGLSFVLSKSTESPRATYTNVQIIELCLRALVHLIVPESDAYYFLEASHPDDGVDDLRAWMMPDKSTAKIVCDVHNIPAVRRRCARGTNRDRRFYVCGMEKHLRCGFFAWDSASMSTLIGGTSTAPSDYQNTLKTYIWTLVSSSETAVHNTLCKLVESQVVPRQDKASTATQRNLDENPSDVRLSPAKAIPSFYGREDLLKDIADGVLCSREMLQSLNGPGTKVDECIQSWIDTHSAFKQSELLLEAALHLITEIGTHESEGMSRWLSLLCHMTILPARSSRVHSTSKSALKKLCGGRKSVYHSVRDHFSLGHQLRALLSECRSLMKAAMIVKEKSRVCRSDFSETQQLTWENLPICGLVGTAGLISEDVSCQINYSKLNSLADTMWGVVKTRPENWRQFCGLDSLPKANGNDDSIGSPLGMNAESPLVNLFWIASILTGKVQAKCFKLIDVALTTTHGTDKKNNSSSTANTRSAIDVTKRDSTPEEIILKGSHQVSNEHFANFATVFVLQGSSAELRRVTYSIASKIHRQLTPETARSVVETLMPRVSGVGSLGKSSFEYLSLLQNICKANGSTHVVTKYAQSIASFVIQQLCAIKYDRSNGAWIVLEAGSGSAQVKKKFDLTDCVHCSRSYLMQHSDGAPSKHGREQLKVRRITRSPPSAAANAATAAGAPSNRAGASSVISRDRSGFKADWHPEQVSSFARVRIDSIKETSLSNEFCAFYTLKYRIAMSGIHITINNPRGRFVKTVTVFASVRPAPKASALKSNDYDGAWHQCAVLQVSRGASQASAVLSEVVVASNLKVEYTEFYDRAGSSSSKASHGTLVIHCPRCNRIVTNAHGVCGSCGEVAFQCRKCRHINYDRLDAFLCVECGYCASGSFSFEVTAGVASNAVAICSDQDHDRLSRLLFGCTSISTKLRNKLRDRVSACTAPHRKPKLNFLMEGHDANSPLLRAFQGLPPLVDISSKSGSSSPLTLLQKQGAVVMHVANPQAAKHESSSRMAASASDRTRSLLRIARQIRSETNALDRRRTGDVIIQHLDRGLTAEQSDEDNDLLGLLEANLLGSSASRLEQNTAGGGADLGPGQAGGTGGRPRGGGQLRSEAVNRARLAASAAAKRANSVREIAEECEKIHMLMREADCECHVLTSRIDAWKRLEDGSLYKNDGLPQELKENDFSPSHCSVCASTVALNLLTLWMSLFSSSPETVTVDPLFLNVLLDESSSSSGGTMSKSLQDYKRQVIVEIATKSETGAELVIVRLRELLKATRDVSYAEILGRILQVEGFGRVHEYEQLALEILSQEHQSANAWSIP